MAKKRTRDEGKEPNADPDVNMDEDGDDEEVSIGVCA